MLVSTGLFWLRTGSNNTTYGAQNANGLLFFEMMFVSMRAMLGALFTFPPNFKIMLKVWHLVLCQLSLSLDISVSLPRHTVGTSSLSELSVQPVHMLSPRIESHSPVDLALTRPCVLMCRSVPAACTK